MSKRAEESANKDFEGRFDTDDQTVIWFMDKMRHSYIRGYEHAEKDLGWHSVDEFLPPMDEEVIVLLDEWNEVRIEPLYRIAFGHVVNKEYCEDFSGWNIPGVKYWMPMPEIPKEK